MQDKALASIARFPPISLAEMDRVELQVRVDTKYVFPEDQLPQVLQTLEPEYRLLEVNGRRGTSYRSLYFDTAGRKHFLDHHNGRTFRSKVRFRGYNDDTAGFLEVKRKTGRGGTDKARLRVAAWGEQLDPEQRSFVQEMSGCTEPLAPVLWNYFTRLTLVHRTRAERITIDHDLRFSGPGGQAALQGLCVAELKAQRADRGSPFMAVMRANGIRPASLSKYCMGLLLLEPRTKYNTFKPLLLRTRRMRAS